MDYSEFDLLTTTPVTVDMSGIDMSFITLTTPATPVTTTTTTATTAGDLKELVDQVNNNVFDCPKDCTGTPIHFMYKCIKAYKALEKGNYHMVTSILNDLMQGVQKKLTNSSSKDKQHTTTSDTPLYNIHEFDNMYNDEMNQTHVYTDLFKKTTEPSSAANNEDPLENPIENPIEEVLLKPFLNDDDMVFSKPFSPLAFDDFEPPTPSLAPRPPSPFDVNKIPTTPPKKRPTPTLLGSADSGIFKRKKLSLSKVVVPKPNKAVNIINHRDRNISTSTSSSSSNSSSDNDNDITTDKNMNVNIMRRARSVSPVRSVSSSSSFLRVGVAKKRTQRCNTEVLLTNTKRRSNNGPFKAMVLLKTHHNNTNFFTCKYGNVNYLRNKLKQQKEFIGFCMRAPEHMTADHLKYHWDHLKKLVLSRCAQKHNLRSVTYDDSEYRLICEIIQQYFIENNFKETGLW